MVDVESTGPIPGDFSMISLGAVAVDSLLNRTFTVKCTPLIGAKYDLGALNSIGVTKDQIENDSQAISPRDAMQLFEKWIKSLNSDKVMFISDNNGFDWQWINWYFHHFLGYNPFGHSSTNLGSFYKGLIKNVRGNFKHLRKTAHSHNPLDDAMGNAEAFIHLIKKYNLDIKDI